MLSCGLFLNCSTSAPKLVWCPLCPTSQVFEYAKIPCFVGINFQPNSIQHVSKFLLSPIYMWYIVYNEANLRADCYCWSPIIVFFLWRYWWCLWMLIPQSSYQPQGRVGSLHNPWQGLLDDAPWTRYPGPHPRSFSTPQRIRNQPSKRGVIN